jgi:hypothetical protein
MSCSAICMAAHSPKFSKYIFVVSFFFFLTVITFGFSKLSILPYIAFKARSFALIF